MSIPPTDSTLELPRLTALESADRALSPLEQEVTTLFGLLRDRLLRYLLALGTPAQEGEEIVQEVFLALFKHMKCGKPRSNLRGWVFRVAHNLALKQRQRRGQWPRWRGDSGTATADPEFDPAPNPEEQLAGGQRRKHLLAVLRALPERDQSCLYLRAEGLRYREIAEVLGLSLGAVSLSLKRSLERLGRADRG